MRTLQILRRAWNFFLSERRVSAEIRVLRRPKVTDLALEGKARDVRQGQNAAVRAPEPEPVDWAHVHVILEDYLGALCTASEQTSQCSFSAVSDASE